MKKLNCALLPPCRRSLQMKFRRATYIAVLWTNATKPIPVDFGGVDGLPTQYGWSLDSNDHLLPTWFEGPAIPTELFGESAEREDEPVQDEGNASEDVDSAGDVSDEEIDMSDTDAWSEDSDSDEDLV